jgi:hypothetical protein
VLTFITGNAETDSWIRADNGWFLGHFLPPSDIRFSTEVEVKWAIQAVGTRNAGGYTKNKTAKTLCILINGHMRIWLRTHRDSDESTICDLSRAGDYLLWSTDVYHDWEAITDCTLITVRWPSLPKDQSTF